MFECIRTYLTQRPIYDTPPREAGECSPVLPIVLLYSEQEARPFFEKVAFAICKEIAPATCREWDGSLPTEGHVILAPADLLQCAVHTLQKEQMPFLFSLASHTDYEQDQELKRALWNHLLNLKNLLA